MPLCDQDIRTVFLFSILTRCLLKFHINMSNMPNKNQSYADVFILIKIMDGSFHHLSNWISFKQQQHIQCFSQPDSVASFICLLLINNLFVLTSLLNTRQRMSDKRFMDTHIVPSQSWIRQMTLAFIFFIFYIRTDDQPLFDWIHDETRSNRHFKKSLFLNDSHAFTFGQTNASSLTLQQLLLTNVHFKYTRDSTFEAFHI